METQYKDNNIIYTHYIIHNLGFGTQISVYSTLNCAKLTPKIKCCCWRADPPARNGFGSLSTISSMSKSYKSPFALTNFPLVILNFFKIFYNIKSLGLNSYYFSNIMFNSFLPTDFCKNEITLLDTVCFMSIFI